MIRRTNYVGWIISLVVIAGVIGTIFYFRAHPVAVKAATPDLTNIHTTDVLVGSITNGIDTTGTVRTNKNTSVSWSTSGQVQKVDVKVGDQVKQNQILAELDPDSNISWVTVKAELLQAQEDLASLQNTTKAVATAKINLISAQTAVTAAQKAINDLNIQPTQAQIDAADAAYLNDQKSVYRSQVAYDTMAGDPTTDLAKAQALNTINNAIQQENLDFAAYNNLKNFTPDATALANANSNLELAQSQLQVAQKAYDSAIKGPDLTEINDAQAKIDQLQSFLDQRYIRAPIDGVITDVATLVDDLVSSGTYAFRIDDMSALYIDLSV